MYRTLTDHEVSNDSNARLQVAVTDTIADGGANHRYLIRQLDEIGQPVAVLGDIRFQKGPIAEVGINGLTNEVLLALVADRLRAFQAGPYACGSNARALEGVETALQELHSRTLDRLNRGVEGTHAL